MKLRRQQSTQLKSKLSGTLRSWLPILQSSLEELEELLQKYESENPYMQVQSGFEEQFSDKFTHKVLYHSDRGIGVDTIEAKTIQNLSLYEKLNEQINAPLFPTPKSEEIAYAIVEEISDEGYFTGDIDLIAKKLKVEPQKVESIRQRFSYLEPPGVGAINAAEAMQFQLRQSGVEEPLYSLVSDMLNDLENLSKFKDSPNYEDALKVIRSFKNPPAIENMEESPPIIPDLIILEKSNGIEVQINDLYYPDIIIEDCSLEHQFVKKKIKEARDLIDALQMRKATLYKIGLMIVEFQYEFFQGGDIKPMKLKDIAQEFDHNPSTISRAIANKYLACNRGIFPMKAFFTTGIDEEVSNAVIKQFIVDAIAVEDKNKPLSDQKLLEMIEAKFGVKMVRRTITKYRKQMKIGGSSERKRFYQLA
jgi:RNA polymerase sigma-54 factor